MSAELAAEAAATRRLQIYIAGINAIGEEPGAFFIPSTQWLPWLQDTPAYLVWDNWAVNDARPEHAGVEWRDVIVLDTDNRAIAVFNLTTHDLSEAANYQALKTALRTAARR